MYTSISLLINKLMDIATNSCILSKRTQTQFLEIHVKVPLWLKLINQFPFKNSSIICNASLSSSSSPPPPTSCPFISCAGWWFWSTLGWWSSACFGSDKDWFSSPFLLFLIPSSTVITQFESERGPARFCQIPMWEFSVSRRRQVRDGDGDLQLLRSFALSLEESSVEDDNDIDDADDDDDNNVDFSLLAWSVATGKFVLALRPLIRMAASS